MARRPAEIVLSAEERRELERRAACYTLPHKVVQRAKMVLYAAEGLSNVEIAAQAGHAAGGRRAVAKTLLRASGWPDLRIERGRVARAVFPPQQVAQVKAIACELPRERGRPAVALLAR